MSPSTGGVDTTLGAIELGVVFSAIFYGAVTVQVYLYSISPKSDRAWLRGLVYLVWMLETLHITGMIAYIYYLTIVYRSSNDMLGHVNWSTVISITLSSAVGTPVQIYFTYRAWVVSGKQWMLAIPPWTAEAFRFCVILGNCYYLANSKTLQDFRGHWGWLVTTTLTVCIMVDTWNSIVLVHYLREHRLGFERTMRYVNSIILWSIETSILVCILSVFSLVFWLVYPHSLLWLSVLMVHAKVYSNSMMISLNARTIRKAERARPPDLSRSWEMNRLRSDPPLSAVTSQPDSAQPETPWTANPQYVYVNYDSKHTALSSPQSASGFMGQSFGSAVSSEKQPQGALAV